MTVKTAGVSASGKWERARDAGANAGAGDTAGGTQGRRVILAEEESFSDVLAYMLRKRGFEVTVCPSGRQTLDRFDRSGADLVLLGLALSGLSAAQVCRGLRSRSDVPVIILTANETETGKAVAYELGVDKYVTVPFSEGV